MAKRQTKKTKELQDRVLQYLSKAKNDNSDFLEASEDSLKAYMREPYGNEVEGQSQFVTSEYLETIEWMMPTLTKLFLGGGQVVACVGTGPEDDQKGELMTQKVNFDFLKQQKGYVLMHDWLKAALMDKFSAVKYWWESGIEKEKAEWTNLSEDEVLALKQDPAVEVTETFYDTEAGTYRISGYDLTYYSRPQSRLVPPEELIIEKSSRGSIQESEFVGHRKKMHENAAMKKFNLSKEELGGMRERFQDNDWLKDTRYEDLGGYEFLCDTVDQSFVYVWECYVNDYDKNGQPMPTKVSVIGEKVVDVVENTYKKPPFAGLTAMRIPHRTVGLSIYDLIGDIQKLRTSLLRAVMNNIYYQNNSINVVNPYRVNLDDVINRREPGATWRTLHDIDPTSAVAPVPAAPLAPQTMQMLDTTGQMKTQRSGVTEFDNEFQTQMTAHSKSGAVSQILGAAHERIEMVARLFAETGVMELFEAYVDMNSKFLDQETAVKLNEEWVTIKPEDIKGKYDITIESGHGAVGKELKIQQLLTLLQTVLPMAQAGYAGVVSGDNLSEIISSMLEMMGFSNPEKYVSHPGNMDPAMEQQHQQYEQQISQSQQQLQMLQQANEQLKFQLQDALLSQETDMAKLAQKAENDADEIDVKEQQLDLKEQELKLKYDNERLKLAASLTGE